MIRVYDARAPEPRVLEHYWEGDNCTFHLHTNPIHRGQYEKNHPLSFNHEMQRIRAKSKRVLIRKIKKLGKMPYHDYTSTGKYI